MTRKRIRKKYRSTAIVLAALFSQWTFAYTYKDDALKFWLSTISIIALWWTFVVPLGIWIFAIVNAVKRNDKWYEGY